MSKEIVEAVHVLEREKGISAERLMAALEVKQRPTNNGNGPFRIITNSIFEIVDRSSDEKRGEQRREAADLRQQCQDVLQSWRLRPKAELHRECEGLRLLWDIQG